MAKTLIISSSTDGHTRSICEKVCEHLSQTEPDISLIDIEAIRSIDLSAYKKVVIGARIRYGKHQKILLDFLCANKTVLVERKTAVFSVNLVARKLEKNTPDTNPYFIKLLQHIAWTPDLCAVFAGKLNYPKYGFWDKQVIRFIMWMTKGPTNLDAVVDYTDWQEVENFSQKIREL